MKKILVFLLSIVMSLSLFGCGSSSEKDSTPKKPDDIALMSYAQTVLKDLYPDCEYSHEKSDYKFVGDSLRYKIEGDVALSKDSATEPFYMIIQFIDEQYDTYDLISLQVGDEKIYENNKLPAPSRSSKYNDNEILTEKNHKIYNDVLDILYSDPDKAEDEILEEIAPQYGMTAEELKDFMYEYTDAYYDYMDNLNKE